MVHALNLLPLVCYRLRGWLCLKTFLCVDETEWMDPSQAK